MTNWWYFSQKIGIDISCKLSPKKTIGRKCQNLFSGKNKNNISNCRLLKFLPSMLSIIIPSKWDMRKSTIFLIMNCIDPDQSLYLCSPFSLFTVCMHTVFGCHRIKWQIFWNRSNCACWVSSLLEGQQAVLFPPWQDFKGKRTTLVTFCLLPAHQAPSEKGSTQKGKNLLPEGANSFLLKQTPFQKGGYEFDIVVSLQSISIPLNT